MTFIIIMLKEEWKLKVRAEKDVRRIGAYDGFIEEMGRGGVS